MFKIIRKTNQDWATKNIPNIESLVDLTGIDKDGQIQDCSALSLIMMRICKRLLENDPNKVISKRSIDFRKKYIHKLIIKNNKLFLNGNKLHIERLSPVPNNRSIIYTPNHGFVEDAMSSLVLAEQQAYFMFGSLPQFCNTLNGFGAYLNGSLLVNRKVKESRNASIAKGEKLLKLGSNLVLYPEGVFNKTPNKLFLNYWPGVFKIAKKSNALIVPIVHLKVENDIYSERLEPIDILEYNDDEYDKFKDDLKEKMSTSLYLMMEKYSKTTREELIGKDKNMHEACERIIKEQADSAGKYYDYNIETDAHYRDLEYEKMQEDLANMSINPYNVKNILHARTLVKENYQKRF